MVSQLLLGEKTIVSGLAGKTFWVIESLPVFPDLPSPSPQVPLVLWSLQTGSPLCRSFLNVACVFPVCFPPAYLVASCGSSWAQGQRVLFSQMSKTLPTPRLAAGPIALGFHPSPRTASVYVSATPMGLGVPGTLPDSSCPHCGPVWGHLRSRSPNVCVQGTVFSVFAPEPWGIG